MHVVQTYSYYTICLGLLTRLQPPHLKSYFHSISKIIWTTGSITNVQLYSMDQWGRYDHIAKHNVLPYEELLLVLFVWLYGQLNNRVKIRSTDRIYC